LQDEGEGVVADDPADDVQIDEAGDAFGGPARFGLEFGESEGAGVEDGGDGASGDIVTEEGGEVDDEREAEGYACGAEAGGGY
jgi:hypothetical protein